MKEVPSSQLDKVNGGHRHHGHSNDHGGHGHSGH